VLDGREGIAQGGDIAGAVGAGAYGVDLQLPVLNSQLIEKRRQHFQDFRIAQGRLGAGAGGTDDLRANLPELAVASLLWTLAAELRADVIELLQQAGLAQLVFDVGADHSSGVFRAQGQRLSLLGLGAGAVFPGVHLLRDNVGLLAYTAGEELSVFEDRSADLAEVVACKDTPGGRFNVIP
jgi:hypothetical protein